MISSVCFISSYPFGWGLAYCFPDSDGVDSAGALCQCPCSGDHTFPGGAGPGGSETGTVGDCGLRGMDCGMDVTGASCQCPCSGDHTFPGGAGPGGSEIGTIGDWGLRGVDSGVD